MQNKIQELVNIITTLIEENSDKILNVRGGRGYSVGHPYPAKPGHRPSQDLGSPGPYSIDDEDDEINKDETPVKISKAFKKE